MSDFASPRRTSGKRAHAALLAAISVTALAGASVSARSEIAPAPVEMTMAQLGDSGSLSDPSASLLPLTPKAGWLAVAITSMLAAVVRLVGARRVVGAVVGAGHEIGRVAAAIANDPGAALARVGKSVSAPLRKLALVGALATFALIGVGIYDGEWILGLLVGGALALTMVGVQRRLRSATR